MPRDLTPRLGMIVDAPQMISVGHRRERAVERQNLQAMTRQIQFANDLRAEQGNDVRTNRELETRKDFLGHRGAAQHMPSFEYEHTFARARQIRGINQAVVAAADYNDVIFLSHRVRKLLTCECKLLD